MAVLCIVNQEIDTEHHFPHIRRELANAMLMVSNIRDPSPSELQEIPQGSVRLGQPKWRHKNTRVQFDALLCLNFVEFYLGAKDRIHIYREIRSLHLAGENL